MNKQQIGTNIGMAMMVVGGIIMGYGLTSLKIVNKLEKKRKDLVGEMNEIVFDPNSEENQEKIKNMTTNEMKKQIADFMVVTGKIQTVDEILEQL